MVSTQETHDKKQAFEYQPKKTVAVSDSIGGVESHGLELLIQFLLDLSRIFEAIGELL
jgi:hypothetical protein